MRIGFLLTLSVIFISLAVAESSDWAEERLIQKQMDRSDGKRRNTIPLNKELGLRKGSTVKAIIVVAASYRGRGRMAVTVDGERRWMSNEIGTSLTPYYVPIDDRLHEHSTISLHSSGRLHIGSIGAVVVEPFRYSANCYYDNDKDFSFQEDRAVGQVTGESIDEIFKKCWDKSRQINRRGDNSISIQQLTPAARPRGLGSAECVIGYKGKTKRTYTIGRVFGKSKAELDAGCKDIAWRTWRQKARYRIEDVQRPKDGQRPRTDYQDDVFEREDVDPRSRHWDPAFGVEPSWR